MFKSAEKQLQKILAGDEDALQRFVDEMTPVIQARVARCLLRGETRDLRQDVKDYTQDIFLNLFADHAAVLRKWREEGGLSLANYIGLIAERRTISALRSGKRNPWREVTPLDDERYLTGAARDPQEQVAQASSVDALLERLRAAVSPLGWHIFQLLYIQDKSVNEVRAATGLSADAVYAWRTRLRRSARECRAQLEATAPAVRS